MHARSLKPPKSALSHAQQALYTLYDMNVLERAVFYFPEPSPNYEAAHDYAFAVVLLHHTARKMRGLFLLCLTGSMEITNQLSRAFEITVCADIKELPTRFPDKEIFLEVDWTRNSELGKRWFLEMFSTAVTKELVRNGILYTYLYMADTQLESLKQVLDFNMLFDGITDGTCAVLQPARKRISEEADDEPRIMSYLMSSIEVNPHTLRNITSAFVTLLRGHAPRMVSGSVVSFSSEYFSSEFITRGLASVKIGFRSNKEDIIYKTFYPSASILSAIAAFIVKEKHVRSMHRIAVAFSGGKDSLCLLLHLSLLSLMAKQGLLDPIGLSDVSALEVTPLTFDPKIPGFILETIKTLCPCALSINDNEDGTIWFKQQVVGMDVLAKIARLEAERQREDTKKTSACSICSRCRRGSLASFVASGNYDALALGHHLLDDLETLLITGIHGASFFGLRGCYSCEVKDFNSRSKSKIYIVRPMLSIHVDEIAKVVFQNGLSCVTSDAAECSLSLAKTPSNEPFPGERLRARKFLCSIDTCGLLSFRHKYRHLIAPFTGELD